MDSIAIVGYSFKFPGGCEDDSSFWDMLKKGKNVMSQWPESRANVDAFYDADGTRKNTLPTRGAHFMNEDPAAFDAPFFSISSKEAAAMDPQQRWLLEESYHAFENAGMSIEKVAGSDTGVFVASSSDDYARMTAKDPDEAPAATATGTSSSILSNRVSWYFDLKGPSLQLNTACSSGMVAMDVACRSLYSGQCTMALVGGSNLLLNPENSIVLANMNFLSPDGLCYSFDHRANGFSRGEGVVVLVLKRLPDAIRNGDMIRAVIRATGSNQDGHTPGLTQPSATSQEELIRKVYKSRSLDFESTRYVEAHGTGTQIGDITEMTALGRVFRHSRSPTEPLYVGSVKANMGHLEGCSGLASIVKAIMILERGVIPPNALFEKLNPRINANLYQVKVPTECALWPGDGLRRISINSFGFGGSNGHIVIDDAHHTLKALGLKGNHQVSVNFGATSILPNGTKTKDADECTDKSSCSIPSQPKLVIWSAKDEAGLKRLLRQQTEYFEGQVVGSIDKLSTFSYTLAARRSVMAWRAFAVLDNTVAVTRLSSIFEASTANAVRSLRQTEIAFVFTGQGAQYARMGLELLQYPVFRSTLEEAGSIFTQLGADWSLIDQLQDEKSIHRPSFSQPLCTALQIALVALLESFGITASAVIGHSSGEIAAAYCVGALSLKSACKVAYHRGRLANKMIRTARGTPGMISVNLREEEVEAYLRKVLLKAPLHIACVNSPSNVTLSGNSVDIDILKKRLDAEGVFAHKVNTGVAYHSPAMEAIAEEYLDCLEDLEEGDSHRTRVFIVSSVTGQRESRRTMAKAQYWVDNMVSPVRFSDALNYLAVLAPRADGLKMITDFIEVGPHGALKRAVDDTLAATGNKKSFVYNSVLTRGASTVRSVMEVAGRLFSRGHGVSILAVNQQEDIEHPAPLLANLPPYPFDHSQTYWHESRISRGWRLRETVSGGLLGVRVSDWNPLEPRWRKTLNVEEMPWIADHNVAGHIFFPATGSLVLALEALKEAEEGLKAITGYNVKEAVFKNPIVVPAEGKVEVITQLRWTQSAHTKTPRRAAIQIFNCSEGDHWTECFSATVQAEYEETAVTEVDGGQEAQLEAERLIQEYGTAKRVSTNEITPQHFYSWYADQGYKYGEAFALVKDVRWDGGEIAIAAVDVESPAQRYDGLVHPAVFDISMQMCALGRSEGMTRNIPTVIPHKISNAWISASGWQPPDTDHIRISVKSRYNATSSGLHASLVIVGDNDKVLYHAGQVEMLPYGGTAVQEARSDRKLLHTIEWKPQLSLLTPVQLQEYCETHSTTAENESDIAEYCTEAKQMLLEIMRRSIDELQRTDWSRAPGQMRKFVSWIERELEKSSAEKECQKTVDDLSATLNELRDKRPLTKMLIEIAENLTSVVQGDTHIIDLLFSNSLAQDMYDAMFERAENIKPFVQLLAHQNPNQRILEVGAGTGGLTAIILSFLDEIEQHTGGSAFAEYVYTDISTSFFEKAQERFAKGQDRMSFKALDLEHNLTAQGFEANSFDVIIAGSVLHATKNVGSTLRNIGRVLKPGGILLFYEPTAPDPFLLSFGFGALPGWWLSEEEYRSHGPLMEASVWDRVLKENGFMGNDLVIRDYQNDNAHWGSFIVSTTEKTNDLGVDESQTALLIVDGESDHQMTVASCLSASLTEALGYKSRTLALDAATEADFSSASIVISLVELGQSSLATMTEPDFKALQASLSHARNVMWVTSSLPPFEGVKDGFLRTLRSEQDKRIVSLTLQHDSSMSPPRIPVETIMKIFRSSFGDLPTDDEYVVGSDGKILTPRLVEETKLNREFNYTGAHEAQIDTWLPGPPLKVQIGRRGALETLQYVEDEAHNEPLHEDHVEIEAKAWPINFRDMFLALGRLDDEEMGSECAGIVTRVGSNCTKFKVGDRVVMNVLGCMRMFPRSEERVVFKLPDDMSFEEACGISMLGVTALYALEYIARLEKGEKILIHSAAGATGQLAIQVAQYKGAEVYATVGYDHKKQYLIDHYGIPEDHIFYSRDTSFAKGVVRVTNGRGVDVVLNSLVGEGLLASWQCIAPHGRFIEIGKADILANSPLPMACFAKNVTFAAIDVKYIMSYRKGLEVVLLTKTMNLAKEGVIFCPKPLNVFGLDELEEAFRFLQSGKSTGRTVVRVDRSVKVQKHVMNERAWSFHDNATYVIAGGLGGLGRYMLRWMAQKGAKHLLVLTRSGATSQAAIEVIEELSKQGVVVRTPQCDVSVAASLHATLEECKATMPPVRGCINAAMVLHDSVFENMTHTQWKQTLRSKIDSSQNLDLLLGDGLDFFVMLSSVAGIFGNASQANYAAGCTFQDALARHRVARGQKAISIDLGLMRTIGIVASNKKLQKSLERMKNFPDIKEEDFSAVLDMCCRPGGPHGDTNNISGGGSQLVVGLPTPADLLAAGVDTEPFHSRPLFAYSSRLRGDSSMVSTAATKANYAALFRMAGTVQERTAIVTESLVAKLARSLSMQTGDIDTDQPIYSYGVDSLVAVEIRNWISKEFAANVPVYEITGGKSLATIGELVTRTTQLQLSKRDGV